MTEMGKPRPGEVSTAWSDAAPGPPGHGLTPHSGVWLLQGPLVTSAGAEGVTTAPLTQVTAPIWEEILPKAGPVPPSHSAQLGQVMG